MSNVTVETESGQATADTELVNLSGIRASRRVERKDCELSTLVKREGPARSTPIGKIVSPSWPLSLS
jgi:hypothetical protein